MRGRSNIETRWVVAEFLAEFWFEGEPIVNSGKVLHAGERIEPNGNNVLGQFWIVDIDPLISFSSISSVSNDAFIAGGSISVSRSALRGVVESDIDDSMADRDDNGWQEQNRSGTRGGFHTSFGRARPCTLVL